MAPIVTFLFFFGWQISQAASLNVSPVRIHLDEETKSATVEVRNTGTRVTSMHVDIVGWSQTEDGIDIYEPSDDLIAVPPIFRLEPGAKQIVRIGLFGEQSAQEESFRVFFSELPEEQPDRPQVSQIRMRLRIGIPVFVTSLEVPNPRLEMIYSVRNDEKLRVKFQNLGNTHVQVKWLYALEDGDVIADTAGAYILPGTTREFELKVPEGIPVATVRAQTDTAGTADYALPVDP